MSFEDCVTRATEDGHGSKQQGDEATRLWKERVAMYQRQGYQPHMAEAVAAEDIKAAMHKQAGEMRHVFLARIANMNRWRKQVGNAGNLGNLSTRSMEVLDMRTRALKRHFDAKVKEYLQVNHRDILGREKDPATMLDMVKELHGEKSGNPNAKALAEAVRHALEDMRLMFNEAGGVIGKLDNYGLPHSHNRMQVMNAGIVRLAKERGVSKARVKAEMAVPGAKGKAARQAVFDKSFDQWFDDIQGEIDWSRIEDFLTGKPFQPEGGSPPDIETQRKFLKDIFDHIAYGERADQPSYGKAVGKALYRARAQSRVLHFKSADGWIKYNKAYGSGDPHKSLMSHVHGMARDIVAMREFGPNPELGLDFQGQEILAEAKRRGETPFAVEANIAHAKRMMRVERGGAIPNGYWGSMSASFFSDTRRVLTSALLERASIASLSDLNSMRLAAKSVGANPNNPISSYLDTVQKMIREGQLSTDEMLQMQWIADTQADPGVAAARFEAEMPSSEWSERLSSGVMRLSGLSSHTDGARFAMQKTFGAHLANQIGKPFDQIEEGLKDLLVEHGISAEDWAQFANDAWTYKAPNGATFLDPLYWREATDLDPSVADGLFLKFQGAADAFVELGVPTQSLFMRGAFDPAGRDLTPGSFPYELMKSSLMFKTFVLSFSYNQYRILQRLPDAKARAAHLANLVAGATAIGAVSLQLTELVKGNDVLPMDNEDFWARAAMKGGGLAIVGDIISAGESSWGGGFPTYATGPMVQLAADAWDLTMSNAIKAGGQALTGQEIDTGFAKDLARFGKRYTPGKDLPFFGPAFDRLLFDQMQLLLDPESITALERAATANENRNGNSSWWMPGSPVPNRAPKLVQDFDPENFFRP